MKHDKTFDAIAKLKEVELELYRLKNALEMMNKAYDAKKEWQGLTDVEIIDIMDEELTTQSTEHFALCQAIEAKLKEKNAD